MTATWDDNLNNGEFRLEWKEEDPDTTTTYSDANSATVGHDILSYTITGLLDGEKYSVRLRCQTSYKTGSWLEAADITKLTAADQPSVSSSTDTSVGLSWTINSNFEGSQQIYRRRTDYNYNDNGRLIATLSTTAASYIDSTPQPDREYEYEVRALTQWVHADSPATTVSTTDSLGLEDRAVPPTEWYAEIAHPDDPTLTPRILDDPVRRPTVNGFPRIELPVPQDETWHATAFDDAPLSVWHDGDREPVDTLEHRRLRPDRTVLEGRGGTQLDQRVIEDVDTQKTHLFVEDLLTTHTDYSVNVDTPQSETEQRSIQEADTDVEHQQAFVSIPSDQPLEFTSDGYYAPTQTGWFVEAENAAGNVQGTVSSSDYSGGTAAGVFGDADEFQLTIENDHTIPAGNLQILFRRDTRNVSNHHGLDLILDGTTIESLSAGVLAEQLAWYSIAVNTEISPGTHTFTVAATGGGEDFEIDAVAAYDNRFGHSEPSSVNADGYLDGPELYPDIARLEMEPIETPLGISEVTLEVVTADDGTVSELAIGEEGTTTWNTATDVSSHTYSYSSLATTARGRIGVGRQGSRSDAAPATGFDRERVDSLTMTAQLDDTPVLTDRSFDGRLIDVLREVADIGNFVFEVRETSSGTTFEWTQIDQRSTNVDPDLADYDIDRQTEDVVEKAVIYGGAQRITRQSVTVTVGSWVDLPFPDSRLVEGRETIYDGSTEYERGTDYEIRYATSDGNPELKALSGGSISDGATVSVDADVKPRGQYTAGGAGASPKTIIKDIPGLASKQMCDQVALYLVEETGDALIEADVTVPHDSVEWSVIEAIDPAQLPTDGPMQVREIESNASQTTLRLASRQSVGEAVQDIRQRTQRNSERV
uniref:Fibronectin type III domain-containing protein n=1 Tax=Natrinema halophilum TaxID=1699371 RepID=A0A7D5GK39_9EURY